MLMVIKEKRKRIISISLERKKKQKSGIEEKETINFKLHKRVHLATSWEQNHSLKENGKQITQQKSQG